MSETYLLSPLVAVSERSAKARLCLRMVAIIVAIFVGDAIFLTLRYPYLKDALEGSLGVRGLGVRGFGLGVARTSLRKYSAVEIFLGGGWLEQLTVGRDF